MGIRNSDTFVTSFFSGARLHVIEKRLTRTQTLNSPEGQSQATDSRPWLAFIEQTKQFQYCRIGE